jgi:hypothetical protein
MLGEGYGILNFLSCSFSYHQNQIFFSIVTVNNGLPGRSLNSELHYFLMSFKVAEKKYVWNRCYRLHVMKKSHSRRAYAVHLWCFITMAEKDTMVLQSCTNSEKIFIDPLGETYPACHDGDQAVNIKAEEVSGAEEEVDPVQITVQDMKPEPEVSDISLMFLFRQMTQMCGNAIVFQISIYLSMHMKQLHCCVYWTVRSFLRSVYRECSFWNIACDVPLLFSFKQFKYR